MSVGKRIKDEREKLGISQTKLADLCNVTKQTIYKYEKDIITNIPIDNLKTIARALNVSPAYLIGLEEIQKNNDIIADIVIELRSDKEFLSAAKSLYDLYRTDKDKFHSASQMLVALLK